MASIVNESLNLRNQHLKTAAKLIDWRSTHTKSAWRMWKLVVGETAQMWSKKCAHNRTILDRSISADYFEHVITLFNMSCWMELLKCFCTFSMTFFCRCLPFFNICQWCVTADGDLQCTQTIPTINHVRIATHVDITHMQSHAKITITYTTINLKSMYVVVVVCV